MTEKNVNESKPSQSGKNEIKTTEKSTDLTRRKFIQIGAATLAISVVGGGVLKLLLPKRKGMGSIKASFEKPNKNPAYVSEKKEGGSLICFARIPDGKVLKQELNKVGAAIYFACDGKKSREEIIKLAAKQLGRNVDVFLPEANQFLTELVNQNLIVTTGKVSLFYKTEVRYEEA